MKKAHLLLLILFVGQYYLHAQNSTAAGIINHYAAVTAIDTCSGKLTVSDTTGFKKGFSALVFQTQGADIVSSNNLFYGVVQNMNFAGRYEKVMIDSVGNNVVFVQKRLLYRYSLSGGVQLVSIERYNNVTITDTLRAKPWDGQTGGILAIESTGILTMNAPITADGAGFRGGIPYTVGANNCTWLAGESDYYYGLGNWRGGYKGEGIALPESGRELGRGPQCNGGGGGNDHNTGGGGGGNIVSGGTGGDNDEPFFLNCDGYFPGIGGYGIASTTNRLFLGGGGGAGHANNGLTSAGAAGGGIIWIEANTINGTQQYISANGLNAKPADGDGGGGAGAGGSIRFSAVNVPSNLAIVANGGNGGNTQNGNSDRCFGPGGGGGGGRILNSASVVTIAVGGLSGVVVASSDGCNGATNGAEDGEVGIVEVLPNIPQGSVDYSLPEITFAPANDSVCVGGTAIFIVGTNGGGWDYQWQLNTGANWQDIGTGSGFSGTQNDTLSFPNVQNIQNNWQLRCKVLRPGCYETTSLAATLTVLPNATANFSTNTVGIQVMFTNNSTNAVSYYWDFGDGNSSTLANPQHVYSDATNVTAILYAIGPCDTAIFTQSLVVLLPPVADFMIPTDLSACDQAALAFENTSSDNTATFNWSFPGGSPASSSIENPTITYASSGNYTATLIVSNASGKDTIAQAFTVTVTELPVADFTFVVQANTSVDFMDFSQNATNYLWNFGDGNTSPQVGNLSHEYLEEGTYTATLTVWNTCDTVTYTQQVPIYYPPTAGFFVADTIIGCGTAAVTFENTSSSNSNTFIWTFEGGTPATSTAENPTVTYSQSGEYAVSLAAKNTIATDIYEQTIVVQIFDNPIGDFEVSVLANGLISVINNSQNGLNYTWAFGDNTAYVDAFETTHQYSQSGEYNITLVVSNPCGAAIIQKTVSVDVSATNNLSVGHLIRLFPNPSTGIVYLDCSTLAQLPKHINIYDLSKRILIQQNSGFQAITPISVEKLAQGVYLLELQFTDGVIWRLIEKI